MGDFCCFLAYLNCKPAIKTARSAKSALMVPIAIPAMTPGLKSPDPVGCEATAMEDVDVEVLKAGAEELGGVLVDETVTDAREESGGRLENAHSVRVCDGGREAD
jgi:hypothetical protein